MNIAAIASMNMPTRIRNRKISTRTIVGLPLSEPRKAATIVGSPSNVNTQAASLAVAAMNRMVPEVRADLDEDARQLRQGDRAVEDDRKEQREEHGDPGGFGRGEVAVHDPDQQDDRGQHRQDRGEAGGDHTCGG